MKLKLLLIDPNNQVSRKYKVVEFTQKFGDKAFKEHLQQLKKFISVKQKLINNLEIKGFEIVDRNIPNPNAMIGDLGSFALIISFLNSSVDKTELQKEIESKIKAEFKQNDFTTKSIDFFENSSVEANKIIFEVEADFYPPSEFSWQAKFLDDLKMPDKSNRYFVNLYQYLYSILNKEFRDISDIYVEYSFLGETPKYSIHSYPYFDDKTEIFFYIQKLSEYVQDFFNLDSASQVEYKCDDENKKAIYFELDPTDPILTNDNNIEGDFETKCSI